MNRLTLWIIAVLGGVTACSAVEANSSAPVEALGHPISSIRLLAYDFGKDPSGRDWIYALTMGEPAGLTVMEAETGRRVSSHPLPGSTGAWGSTVTPDGKLYIGTFPKGRLFRYDPATDEVSDLGSPLPGETHLFQLTYDDEGRIYGGTYPGARLFQFNPRDGAVRDYGPVSKDQSWLRTVAYVDGFIYAAADPSARFVRVEPTSGKRKEIPLPGNPEGVKVNGLKYSDGQLYLNVEPGGRMLVYDVGRQDWAGELPGFHGREVSPAGPDGRVYYRHKNDELFTYDPKTRAAESTGAGISVASRQWGWVSLEGEDFSGPTLVTGDHRGGLFYYNPQTGKSLRRRGQVARAPNHLHYLGRGPDGAIYSSGFLSPQGMGRFDPETGDSRVIGGVTQAEGMAVHDGMLYVGTYPNAGIVRYKPGERAAEPLFKVGDQQDRPRALVSAGDVVAIGTIPKAGLLGGALTIYDPKTGDASVHRNVVENHSVISLAYGDGILWGGTSTAGGLQASSADEEARLFAWDVAKGKKIWEGVPVPGESIIIDLALDERGILWGLINGGIFAFDPGPRKLIRAERYIPRAGSSRWGHGEGMDLFEGDGRLYGTANGKSFRLDRKTWKFDVIHEDARLFAQDRSGDVYFADGSGLFRLRLSSEGD